MHASKQQLAALTMLTARSDFLAIQKHGKRWTSRGLVLQVRENDVGIIRVGYTVTKRVDKRAVVRNRIKRRLRSIAADILPLKAKVGYDYILVGRASTNTYPYKQLMTDLKWCLKRTECYNIPPDTQEPAPQGVSDG